MNKWMANLDDGKSWNTIGVIPSTHNSGAIRPEDNCMCLPWFWAKCQHNSIERQLNIGIRGFDLRLIHNENGIFIGHTILSDLQFSNVLETFKAFLHENPSEFLFVFIKPDWPTRGNWNFDNVQKMWNDMVEIDNYQNGYKNTIFMNPIINIQNILIKHLRGKIIFIPDGRLSQYKNTSLTVTVGTLPMSKFNVCQTWDKRTFDAAKETITNFINNECKICDEDNNNIIQINVVINPFPPYFVARNMNKWLLNKLKLETISHKKLGFVSIDFASEHIVRSILNLS